jgi:KDO2-lipid IV(A) lauroyltransferase
MKVRAVPLIFLKKRNIVAFIADQDAGPNAPFFPFLGRFASTFQGPALFARITKAPVIFCFSYRNPEGRLSFYVEEFVGPSFDPNRIQRPGRESLRISG